MTLKLIRRGYKSWLSQIGFNEDAYILNYLGPHKNANGVWVFEYGGHRYRGYRYLCDTKEGKKEYVFRHRLDQRDYGSEEVAWSYTPQGEVINDSAANFVFDPYEDWVEACKAPGYRVQHRDGTRKHENFHLTWLDQEDLIRKKILKRIMKNRKLKHLFAAAYARYELLSPSNIAAFNWRLIDGKVKKELNEHVKAKLDLRFRKLS